MKILLFVLLVIGQNGFDAVYTNYKEDLGKDFDLEHFQPFDKVNYFDFSVSRYTGEMFQVIPSEPPSEVGEIGHNNLSLLSSHGNVQTG